MKSDDYVEIDNTIPVVIDPDKIKISSGFTLTKLSTGSNDWKNLVRNIKDHESTHGHIKSMLTFQKRLSIIT